MRFFCPDARLLSITDDHSRVRLRCNALEHEDYINANFVDGFHRTRAYIATQGPLSNTFADFWLMVWEQNTHVIVMITNFIEGGKVNIDSNTNYDYLRWLLTSLQRKWTSSLYIFQHFALHKFCINSYFFAMRCLTNCGLRPPSARPQLHFQQ